MFFVTYNLVPWLGALFSYVHDDVTEVVVTYFVGLDDVLMDDFFRKVGEDMID